eukprot:SAG31_NODE_4418_length_3251_cov_5.297313_2_plen_98_part_00
MQRNIRSIPLFIEQFVNSEAEFAEKKDAWRCDGDRQRFSDWSAWRDVLERVAMPKQGAYTPLHLDDFICERCTGTRDAVCPHCSDWERKLNLYCYLI